MANETVLNERYRLDALHGSGGMAVIYRATDLLLRRTVAIKVLRPTLTSDPTFLERFRAESINIANLQHPNIVTVHDMNYDPATQSHYMIMEFVDGQDLKRYIKDHGALSVELALRIAIGICAGIGYAHRAGLVHADVKPQNVLLANTARSQDLLVKVTDFGIAQVLSNTMPIEREQVVWGSPHYFAPEQARGDKPSAASDVYAIGIVLFEMLTGRLPYTGSSQAELSLAHLQERIPHVNAFNRDVPEEISRVVYKTMSKDPTGRYRLADQLGSVLVELRDRFLRGAGAQANVSPPVPTINPAQPPPSTTGDSARIPPPPSRSAGWSPMPPQPTPPYGTPPMETPPTQRVDLAPNAPSYQPPYRPEAPAFGAAGRFQPAAGGMGSTGASAPMSPNLGTSGRSQPVEQVGSVFDPITIALGFLAFVSVSCLIPLAVLVVQARL